MTSDFLLLYTTLFTIYGILATRMHPCSSTYTIKTRSEFRNVSVTVTVGVSLTRWP